MWTEHSGGMHQGDLQTSAGKSDTRKGVELEGRVGIGLDDRHCGEDISLELFSLTKLVQPLGRKFQLYVLPLNPI